MLSTKRSWRRSRPGAFDHIWEKYEKSVSETVNDNLLAEVRRRVNDPKFVPAVKLPPHLLMEILDDVLCDKAELENQLVEQHMELEWLREQLLRVAAELEANGPRKKRWLFEESKDEGDQN